MNPAHSRRISGFHSLVGITIPICLRVPGFQCCKSHSPQSQTVHGIGHSASSKLGTGSYYQCPSWNYLALLFGQPRCTMNLTGVSSISGSSASRVHSLDPTQHPVLNVLFFSIYHLAKKASLFSSQLPSNSSPAQQSHMSESPIFSKSRFSCDFCIIF